ncbi:MAG TPA: ATP-dependent Clp protease ATP-binding subunit [Myxococcaceae bacterium]|nr:ATP-dependent Clp protease ATP-binding subunit [Myxococcaceae bacterium]
MVDSSDLALVLSEAEDIAQSVSQKPTTAHAVLALFTVDNPGQRLLKERGVDEDRLLALVKAAPTEPDGTLRELRDRAREIARACGSREADCLHLLIAVTRLRCAGHELLAGTGLDLTAVRNTALSYFLSGRMPRKFVPRDARAPARPAPAPPRASTTVALLPEGSPRALVDSDGEALAALPFPAPAPSTAAAPAPVLRVVTPAEGLPWELDPAAFPLLAQLGRNLTALAQESRLDPVVGRAREMEEVLDVLGKRRTNNPCLVGEPGVGKTAVVEGVAQRLLSAPGDLGKKLVVELSTADLLAGTSLRGSLSERLNGLKEEMRRAAGRVVVFLDEIHTLVGAGSTGEGAQDAANELKGALARGEFPCIGATTHDEFRRFIQADPALERRFTAVVVREPTVSETVEILSGLLGRYEEHHRVRYARAAVEAAASLAARYVTDRHNPDKAVSLLDLAGSRVARAGRDRVEVRDVAEVVARIAGLPVERLLTGDAARLLRLEEELGARVVGHAAAVERVARVLRRNYAGFASRRPLGSFLFLGPTGVGKTELARALAEVLFGTRDALIRLDMSELSESHATSRLIGAPAGYVGYQDGGQLTEAVRRRPSAVVLLDEVEKAHRDVLMLLLQLLEEGRLTDGKGRQVDFSSTVVVLTSNLGAEAFGRTRARVGFGSESADEGGASAALTEARRALPPELWNRIDERLVFGALGREELRKIARMLLEESSRRLAEERGIAFAAGDDVVDVLLDSEDMDPLLGARPVRQIVQRSIEAPLAEHILAGKVAAGSRVRLRVVGGRIRFGGDTVG